MWRGEPLPRGRHKLPAEVVRASQRDRLLRAMLECVAASGFEATTVPAVAAAARVSPNAFYTNFTDKFDCFSAASDVLAEELIQELLTFASEPTWIMALRKGLARYLQRWAERPAYARAYLLSPDSGGERAYRQRERTYQRFCVIFEQLAQRARAEHPDLPPLPPLATRALVVAITDVVAEEVRGGRTDHLEELEGQLAQLVIRLLADDATAATAL